jgi:Z1 domain
VAHHGGPVVGRRTLASRPTHISTHRPCAAGDVTPKLQPRSVTSTPDRQCVSDDDFLLEEFVICVRAGLTLDHAQQRLLRLGGDEATAARIRALYEENAGRIRDLEIPRSLTADGHESWYAGPNLELDRYWPPLRELLLAAGWDPDDELKPVDRASTKVVAHLDHPYTERYSTRGLVLGHVQAGKTTNFTAVIAKAADAKFKLFIVLSGIHNGLRNQTQVRLEDQLKAPNPESWFVLPEPTANFHAGFNPDAHLTQSDQRVLCVVKKNGPRLRHLIAWLRAAQPDVLANCPTIVIDDEADQAGIDTSRPGAAPTRINRLIRELLDFMPRIAYVGYTATPFANLLIEPSDDDLYPRDFIIDLPQPKGHFGTEVIFGREPLDDDDDEDDQRRDGYDMIRHVADDEIGDLRPARPGDRDDFIPSLTDSLAAAISYFWMATAARRARTNLGHSTMLIHTSVHPVVHERFRRMISAHRDSIVDRVAAGDPTVLEPLRAQWDEETSRVPAADFQEEVVSFDVLEPHLADVMRGTQMIADNSGSADRLVYGADPRVVIAIGGNTLSRGLTLEGLVVSFFVRAATAYDTLLQMGRWFGYRRGYADLPRIWMTRELHEWFRDLALVEREIRRDIERYEQEHLTPLDFAVRIRMHPKLSITAASKMQDAINAEMSYSGQRPQTIAFHHRDPEWLRNNFDATRSLIRSARERGVSVDPLTAGPRILRAVETDLILEFLSTYRFHERSRDLRGDLLSGYIRDQMSKPSAPLSRWNIAVMCLAQNTELGDIDIGLDERVAMIRRARLNHTNEYADIKALMSKVDRVVDLGIAPAAAREMTEQQLVDARRPSPCEPATGLLAIYPISASSPPKPPTSKTRVPLGAADDVIGVALVFPEATEDTPQGYMSADLSNVYREELEEGEELEETEDGGTRS